VRESSASLRQQVASRVPSACLTSVVLTALLGLVRATAAGEPPSAAPQFEDVTAAAGIDHVETLGGVKMRNIVEASGVGCGFLDFDRDGWMDLYLVNGCWMEGVSDPKLPENQRRRLADATDRLFRNRGDGTFEDVTAKAGLRPGGFGMAVVVADYDADGDPDIYVTNYGPNSLYRNNGDGTFTDVASEAGVDDPGFSLGAVFLDFDRDGILDLFVGNYVNYDPDYKYYYAPDGFPGPLAYTGQPDRLYRGTRSGRFEEVSEAAQVRVEPPGRAMGVGAADLDGDAYVDVFVSNDAMENFLFRNQRNGKLKNVAFEAGVAFGESGEATAAMAVEIADYDNDGRLDVFVPDMKYSCLYHNVGDGMFEEMCARSGIAAASGQFIGWGAVFADFDLDGNLDLYVANGDAHHLEAQEDLLFVGDGEGNFRDVSTLSGDWAMREFVSRGVAGGDFDNDGDVDLLVANLNERPVLLRNDTERAGRHWVGFELVGAGGSRDAIGAIVRVHTGDVVRTRVRASAGSYLSQHDPRLHFGLGSAARVDRVEIVWPDGTKQEIGDLEVDRYHVVREPEVTR